MSLNTSLELIEFERRNKNIEGTPPGCLSARDVPSFICNQIYFKPNFVLIAFGIASL